MLTADQYLTMVMMQKVKRPLAAMRVRKVFRMHGCSERPRNWYRCKLEQLVNKGYVKRIKTYSKSSVETVKYKLLPAGIREFNNYHEK